MALYGHRYIQDDEPTSATAGFEWYSPSTGEIKVRATDGSTWKLVGYSDRANLGIMSKRGGISNGSVTGDTLLARLASPAFTGPGTLNGITIADQTWVTQQINDALGDIAPKIATISGAAVTNKRLSDKFGFATGITWTANGERFLLPKPVDKSGKEIPYANCVWGAWPVGFAMRRKIQQPKATNINMGDDSYYDFSGGDYENIQDCKLTGLWCCPFWGTARGDVWFLSSGDKDISRDVANTGKIPNKYGWKVVVEGETEPYAFGSSILAVANGRPEYMGMWIGWSIFGFN